MCPRPRRSQAPPLLRFPLALCLYVSFPRAFASSKAKRFLRECYGVLAVGGILRAVVPDLRAICEEYLNGGGEPRVPELLCYAPPD